MSFAQPDTGQRIARQGHDTGRRLRAHLPRSVVHAGSTAIQPLRTGLAFLPNSALTGLMTLLVTPRLAERVSLKALTVSGLAFIIISLLLMSRISVHADYVDDVLPTMLLMGIGIGLLFMPTVSIVMSAVAPSDAGVASGVANVTVQFGASLGVASVGQRGCFAHRWPGGPGRAARWCSHRRVPPRLCGGGGMYRPEPAGGPVLAQPGPAPDRPGTSARGLRPADPGPVGWIAAPRRLGLPLSNEPPRD